MMGDNETLRIELDTEAGKLLTQLQGKYASELISRAVDACGDGPVRISAADLHKIEATGEKAEDTAAGRALDAGIGALTNHDGGDPERGSSALRLPLIAGLSLLIGAGAALGAALIPTVVRDDTSRVLLAIAMVGTAATLIALTGLIVARLTAGHAGDAGRAASRPAAMVRTDGAGATAAVGHHTAPVQAPAGPPEAAVAADVAGPGAGTDSTGWSSPPQVHSALKFGWYVAEVRGWNRPAGPQPAGDSLPTRQDHALPLRIERTRTERRIESQAVLTALTTELDMDTTVAGDSGSSLMTVIEQRAKALASAAPHTAEAATGWDALADSIYQLDAHAQDTFAAMVRRAGRGLPAGPRTGGDLLGAQPGRAVRPADRRLLAVPARPGAVR